MTYTKLREALKDACQHTPPHTSAYQHIYQRMPPNATIFRVSICYHQLKYYSIIILYYSITAKFYIDTISQTTKIPSFYVLNRIAIGRPTIQLALVVGTNQTSKCWATP